MLFRINTNENIEIPPLQYYTRIQQSKIKIQERYKNSFVFHDHKNARRRKKKEEN